MSSTSSEQITSGAGRLLAAQRPHKIVDPAILAKVAALIVGGRATP